MAPGGQLQSLRYRHQGGRLPCYLLGPGLIGAHAAITIDAVLWALGTITGLVASLAVPYLMVTRLQAAPDAAFGGWLMPVVPPMVSAATGALLVPHLPAGQLRLTMLLACYAMFGLSLIASLLVITQLWRRLVRYGPGPPSPACRRWRRGAGHRPPLRRPPSGPRSSPWSSSMPSSAPSPVAEAVEPER